MAKPLWLFEGFCEVGGMSVGIGHHSITEHAESLILLLMPFC